MTSTKIDEVDQKLLNIIQKKFSLEERPFKVIADILNITEEEVLERVTRLKKNVIRQISGIFDTKSLGYCSSLVAAKVNMNKIDEVAQIINQHPGVTHNYQRNDVYNLWFTIAVPPDSQLGLEKSVRILADLAEIDKIILLPTLKLYKIGVQFDMNTDKSIKKVDSSFYKDEKQKSNQINFTDKDKQLIRVLQKDLKIVSRPFDELASQMGITVKELIDKIYDYQKSGIMRRFAGVLYHQNAGFIANGMGAWIVPSEMQDEVGKKMATYQAVSHCYLRPTYSDWPYNIFTMVHGRSIEEVEMIFKSIEEETGIKDRKVLYSQKEYKKTSIKYFDGNIEKWEEKFLVKGVK